MDELSKVEKRLIMYSAPETSRPDLLKVTIDNLLKRINDNANVTKAQEKNVMKFLKIIPAEAMYLVLRDIFSKEGWMKRITKDDDIRERLDKHVKPVNDRIKEETDESKV